MGGDGEMGPSRPVHRIAFAPSRGKATFGRETLGGGCQGASVGEVADLAGAAFRKPAEKVAYAPAEVPAEVNDLGYRMARRRLGFIRAVSACARLARSSNC